MVRLDDVRGNADRRRRISSEGSIVVSGIVASGDNQGLPSPAAALLSSAMLSTFSTSFLLTSPGRTVAIPNDVDREEHHSGGMSSQGWRACPSIFRRAYESKC